MKPIGELFGPMVEEIHAHEARRAATPRRSQWTYDQPRTKQPVIVADFFEWLWPECMSCGSTWRCVLDHVIPLTWGGADTPANVQALCFNCNARKGARHAGDYRSPTERGLIPPEWTWRNLATALEIWAAGNELAPPWRIRTADLATLVHERLSGHEPIEAFCYCGRVSEMTGRVCLECGPPRAQELAWGAEHGWSITQVALEAAIARGLLPPSSETWAKVQGLPPGSFKWVERGARK